MLLYFFMIIRNTINQFKIGNGYVLHLTNNTILKDLEGKIKINYGRYGTYVWFIPTVEYSVKINNIVIPGIIVYVGKGVMNSKIHYKKWRPFLHKNDLLKLILTNNLDNMLECVAVSYNHDELTAFKIEAEIQSFLLKNNYTLSNKNEFYNNIILFKLFNKRLERNKLDINLNLNMEIYGNNCRTVT